MKLPDSYYKDRDDLHKRIREVDEKHTLNYNNLNIVLTKNNTLLEVVADTNKDIKTELEKTNDHLSNQDKRLTNVETDVEMLEKDTETFKEHLKREQDEARDKFKELLNFVLKGLGIIIGGGGAAWLVHPLFDLLKVIFK